MHVKGLEGPTQKSLFLVGLIEEKSQIGKRLLEKVE